MKLSCGPLLALALVMAAAYHSFLQGFFLSRIELTDVTSCGPEQATATAANPGCPTAPPRFQRLVLFIIDGLRIDFAHPKPEDIVSADGVNEFMHHHFTAISEALVQEPSHAALFNAYADPPTVTLQRIKGFTTGGLPTFFEARKNFGSSDITEDNIIQQARAAGKR